MKKKISIGVLLIVVGVGQAALFNNRSKSNKPAKVTSVSSEGSMQQGAQEVAAKKQNRFSGLFSKKAPSSSSSSRRASFVETIPTQSAVNEKVSLRSKIGNIFRKSTGKTPANSRPTSIVLEPNDLQKSPSQVVNHSDNRLESVKVSNTPPPRPTSSKPDYAGSSKEDLANIGLKRHPDKIKVIPLAPPKIAPKPVNLPLPDSKYIKQTHDTTDLPPELSAE